MKAAAEGDRSLYNIVTGEVMAAATAVTGAAVVVGTVAVAAGGVVAGMGGAGPLIPTPR